MLFTFLRTLSASWHFGGATRSRSPAAALRGYEQALSSLDDPRVNPEAPWSRSMVPLALVGYCDAAEQLGCEEQAERLVARWRPVLKRWAQQPLTDAERRAFARLAPYLEGGWATGP